jgi:hypothetical protein
VSAYIVFNIVIHYERELIEGASGLRVGENACPISCNLLPIVSMFFFTVTTAGVSQPQYIFTQVDYEAFQPLQDGFK